MEDNDNSTFGARFEVNGPEGKVEIEVFLPAASTLPQVYHVTIWDTGSREILAEGAFSFSNPNVCLGNHDRQRFASWDGENFVMRDGEVLRLADADVASGQSQLIRSGVKV